MSTVQSISISWPYSPPTVSSSHSSCPTCIHIVLLVIAKLGKKLQLRQRVIATATVFFRRFYVKNLYCETDPFIVIAACVYVAAKAEESPIHIKNVVSEARMLFSSTSLFPSSYPRIESYLQTKSSASSPSPPTIPSSRRWNSTSSTTSSATSPSSTRTAPS